MSDEALASRAKRGDRAATEELVRRFLKPVFSVCRRILGRDADAEDAVQEVFVRLLREFPKYEDGRRFAPWLFKMAANTAYTWARSDGRYRAAVARRPPAPLKRPAQQADPALAAAVAALPDRYGLVLSYKFAQGLSNEEIGELMNVAPDSVRVLVFRALSWVRDRAGAERKA